MKRIVPLLVVVGLAPRPALGLDLQRGTNEGAPNAVRPAVAAKGSTPAELVARRAEQEQAARQRAARRRARFEALLLSQNCALKPGRTEAREREDLDRGRIDAFVASLRVNPHGGQALAAAFRRLDAEHLEPSQSLFCRAGKTDRFPPAFLAKTPQAQRGLRLLEYNGNNAEHARRVSQLQTIWQAHESLIVELCRMPAPLRRGQLQLCISSLSARDDE